MAVLIPVSVVACSSTEKPGSAKAAYIKQVDVICKDVIPKSAAIGAAKDQATAQKQADLWQDAYNRVNAYPVPGESFEQGQQFATDLNNLNMAYTAAANQLAAGNQARAQQAFADADQLKKNAAKTAKEYGYHDCVAIAT